MFILLFCFLNIIYYIYINYIYYTIYVIIFIRYVSFHKIFHLYNSSEEFKPEPITIETLKKEKTYKFGKKQQKELDTMRKKHLKERQTMQKNHCSAIDKLVKGKEYVNFGFL